MFFIWGVSRVGAGGDTLAVARVVGFAVLWVSRQLRSPKVSKGRAESPLVRPQSHTPARRGNDAPTTAREQGLSSYGFSACFGARRFPKGERKALWCAAGAYPLSRMGIDAPTTARVVGLPPRGGIVLSFDAKESTKESQRHGDSGKKPFTAHF